MKILKVLGWIFLLVGILGFFSNPIVGASAWFHADLVHNLVHLLTGLIMLWVVYKAPAKAGVTLKTFGWIYVAIAVLGFLLVSGTGSLLGIVEINGADNWLHLILGLVLLWAGMKEGGRMNAPQSPAPEMPSSEGGSMEGEM